MASSSSTVGFKSNNSNDTLEGKAASACRLLLTIFPTATLVHGSPGYERARRSYWSKEQQDATPTCIFQPQCAAQVSVAIIILRFTCCNFAVKSGGHGKWIGESSITGGIVIDLIKLDHVNLSQDRSTVHVGPGNCWGQVYSSLEPLGLSVVGGRASGVGVGGFLLGGGISWYTNEHGLGCDNIVSYEVVLADGSIVTASQDTLPDLFRALRGGAGNLGVVTSFEMLTVCCPGVWGGERTWPMEHGPVVQRAFLETGKISDAEDPALFCILALITTQGQWTWYMLNAYTKPEEPVHALRHFAAIPQPLTDSCQVQSLCEMVDKLQANYPNWVRSILSVVCIKVDAETLAQCCNIWMEETDPLIREVSGWQGVLAIQYIAAGVGRASQKRGGNVLGLGDGSFIMINPEPYWIRAEHTFRVYEVIDRALDRMADLSRRRGTDHPYLYSNYASRHQNPIASYGASAIKQLTLAANKYDPDGVFQTLRSTGFNLSGLPPNMTSSQQNGTK